ncbi:MAG: hypothetical protein FWF46_00370 [Oscillospiraceae bacterium]|nr:hypothetical protein [Oscillospiraceae bacterium]
MNNLFNNKKIDKETYYKLLGSDSIQEPTEEINTKAIKNLTIKETAKLMGKSEQFVRIGLQRGLLPIGTAVQLSSRFTYHISPKLLEEYLGVKACKNNIGYSRMDKV